MIEREGVGGEEEGGERGSVKCDLKEGTLPSPLKSSKQFYSQNNEHICSIEFLLARKNGRTCFFFLIIAGLTLTWGVDVV